MVGMMMLVDNDVDIKMKTVMIIDGENGYYDNDDDDGEDDHDDEHWWWFGKDLDCDNEVLMIL